jgi:hypothetical protein
MPMNDPNAPSNSSAPRLRILINGVAISGAIKADIHTANSYRGDRFSATLALYADPAYGLDYWGDDNRKGDLIEIQMGVLPPGALEGNVPWQSMFIGTVDNFSADPAHGTCQIEGRDLSSFLVDARTRETYANLTASQVATKIAASHTFGPNNTAMTADVDTTTTRVGVYYKQDHDHLTGDAFGKTTTEWDLLTKIAKEEGMDLWVSDTTLHLKYPQPDTTPNPFVVQYTSKSAGVAYPTANVADLQIRRDLQKARDIRVTVKCWNSKGNKATQYHAGSSSKDAEQFSRNGGALDPVRAQNTANAWYEEIMRHERKFTVSMPNDLTITAQSIVQLTGPLGSWAQNYRVDEVTRTMSFEGGLEVHLTCKNHSTNSDANVG